MTAGIVSCVPLESMAAGSILVAVPQLASSGSAASIVKPIPLFASKDRKCRDVSTQRVSQMLHETLSTACEELRRHFLDLGDDALRCVMTWLDNQSRWRIATACKRLHGLAPCLPVLKLQGERMTCLRIDIDGQKHNKLCTRSRLGVPLHTSISWANKSEANIRAPLSHALAGFTKLSLYSFGEPPTVMEPSEALLVRGQAGLGLDERKAMLCTK